MAQGTLLDKPFDLLAEDAVQGSLTAVPRLTLDIGLQA